MYTMENSSLTLPSRFLKYILLFYVHRLSSHLLFAMPALSWQYAADAMDYKYFAFGLLPWKLEIPAVAIFCV